MDRHLSKPLDVLGTTVRTCESAAYRVRQHVIGNYERQGRDVVRLLREVRSPGDLVLAEGALKIWLQEHAQRSSRTIEGEFWRV